MIDGEQFDCLSKILNQIEEIQKQTFKILETEALLTKKLKSANYKTVKVEKDLQKEQSLNRNKLKFLCLFCKESKQDQESLNHHYLGAHNTKALFYGPMKYSCRMCFKEFKGLLNLILHERNTEHKHKYVLYKANKI